jgi:hypothetical protein
MNWFDKEHPIPLCLKTFTVTVGRPPTKDKNINIRFTLDVGTGDLKGVPDWLQEARDFVMKTNQTATDVLVLSGLNISMGDPNLFKKKCVEAPKCTLRKFVCYAAGTEEDPETLLGFIVKTRFSTDLCRWLGQMAGETFTATFEGVVPEPGAIVLKSEDDEDDEEDGDDAGEGEEEEDEQVAQTRRRNAKVVVAAAPKPPAKKPLTESQQVAKAKEAIQLM